MTLAPPPLPVARDCCLFLDVDGTLLDIAPTPDAVRVDEPLRDLLRRLERVCDGALALVSGRSIADLDELFDPLYLAAAGVHGCERRDVLGHWMRPILPRAGFEEFRESLGALVAQLGAVLFEDKALAVALHYRQAPHLEGPLRKLLTDLAPSLPDGYGVLEGDEVIEIKPAAHDKGSAIDAFMRERPFIGRFPIFIGDDLTDRDGFAAVRRHHGMAIGVGSNVQTEWRLDDPDAVKRWLARFANAGRT
jgi:trehalose 6-phosphate phosphatase